MKKQFLTGIPILVLMMLFYSCQEEEPLEAPVFQEVFENTSLSGENILAGSLSDFTNMELNGRTESAATPFGILDFNNIVKRIASKDQPGPNYTIPLTPPDSVENSLEYMVLISEEEEFRGYIIQFQAADEFAYTIYDPSQLTGTTRLLDFERKVLSENQFVNGVDIYAANEGRVASLESCSCRNEYITESYQIEAGLWSTRVVVNTYCDCSDPNFQGGEEGGPGGEFGPGVPIPFPGGGGFGGGGSTGGGNSGDEPGGIPAGGDPIGITPPPTCPIGFERFGLGCLPECEPSFTRNSEGICWKAAFECKTTGALIKAAFPEISITNANKLAAKMNELAEEFGLENKYTLHHFLGQSNHELGGFSNLNEEESFNYSAGRLLDVFPSKFSTTDTNKINPADYDHDSQKLGNFVYKYKNGNGNEASGDGYKYRGRGLFQLTGRENYQNFTNFYQQRFDATKNFVINPDLVATDTDIAIISALWYFKNRVLKKVQIEDGTTVKEVTEIINDKLLELDRREEKTEQAQIQITECAD